MKYKILDKVNKEYLDLTKYCVNGFGEVMLTNGLVLQNQSDFEIKLEAKDKIEDGLKRVFKENGEEFASGTYAKGFTDCAELVLGFLK